MFDDEFSIYNYYLFILILLFLFRLITHLHDYYSAGTKNKSQLLNSVKLLLFINMQYVTTTNFMLKHKVISAYPHKVCSSKISLIKSLMLLSQLLIIRIKNEKDYKKFNNKYL